MSGSDLLSENQVFASLDPHMRSIQLHKMKAMAVDTVGFISDLPDILLTAFRSTLEEVVDADLIVHVRDIKNVIENFFLCFIIFLIKNLARK